ncbi:MAG: hypothetical protein HUU55_00220 [Myxococcales bacterium]|nr:hypothetical protein [Myxococcales bacterium]
MGYTLPANLGVDALDEYCGNVTANLIKASKRIPDILPLIPPWEQMEIEFTTYLDERRQLRRTLNQERAGVKITDVYWDEDVGVVSSESYHVSGKKADQDPYRSLFGTTKAADARKLGPDEATKFGDSLIERAKVLNHPGLVVSIAAFEATNNELRDAGKARSAAASAVELHILKGRQMIPKVQELIDKTEAALLTIRPGDDKLIRAILSPD